MKRLLLVDDDKTFVSVLAAELFDMGLEVHPAHSVAQALSILETGFVPTHCLVDLKMPGASGLELIAYLRELGPRPVIVVLTGHASIETAVNAVKLGATYYLTKPVGVAQILAAFDQTTPSTELGLEPAPVQDLEEVQRAHIKAALIRNHYNITHTAKELGLHRRTLQRKLFKLGLDLDEGEHF